MKSSNIDDLKDNTLETDFFEKLDKMSDREVKQEALKDLRIDVDDYENSQSYAPRFSAKTEDKILNIKAFVESIEAKLKGRELNQKNDKEVYIQTSQALAGESFIQKVILILTPFSRDANLIAKGNSDVFILQFENAFYKISDMVLEKKNNVPKENVASILTAVKDTFWQIGKILDNTNKNMDAVMGKMNDMTDDAFRNDRKRGGF